MKPGKNDPCPCGSGKKYKKCCQEKFEARSGVQPPQQKAEIAGKPGSLGNSGIGGEPNPQEIDALVAMFKQGRYAETEALARAMVERFPRHNFGWKAMGTALLQQGRAAEAVAPLQEATKLSPGDAKLHNNLGNTLAKLGRMSEAEASYRQALKLDPDFTEAHYNLGNALLELGRLPEAEASYRRALEIKPDFADAHSKLSNTLKKQGRFADAEASYRRVLEIKPDFAIDTYRNSFRILRSRHMDYPMNIQLETVGRCNAKCDFCPHSELDRKLDVMSDKLFEKIVNEASAIPPSSPLNFFMNVVNEPFMDKKIFSRMRMLNEKIPHATIGIYTNMNVVPPLFFEKLAEIRQISCWNVSFNAANKEEYEESMAINFERTVANIKRFLCENRKQKFVEGPIYLSRIASGNESDTRFIEECKLLFAEYNCNSDFIPACKNRASWLGQVQAAGLSNVPLSMPCNQWLSISIFCNGLVPHCCMDAKGEFPFGDVNKQSILEIYNSPHFRKLRESVVSRDAIYPCNTCALL